MVRLSEKDLLTVLGVAQEIAGVGTRDEFGAVSLRELSSLVRSDVTTLNEVDPASGRLVYLAEPESFVVPEGLAELFAGLTHQHPLIRHHAESGDGSAIKVSDFPGAGGVAGDGDLSPVLLDGGCGAPDVDHATGTTPDRGRRGLQPRRGRLRRARSSRAQSGPSASGPVVAPRPGIRTSEGLARSRRRGAVPRGWRE